MPDQQTAQKIASHKFGRRKLATDSAWVQTNKKLKNDSDWRGRVVADPTVQSAITAMNAAFQAAFAGVATISASPGGDVIQFNTTNYFLPRSVYFGYIDFPTGSLTAEQRATFGTQEKIFADQAGILRARIAISWRLLGITDDMRNVGNKPNPGGVVTGGPTGHHPEDGAGH